ncbi:aminotransferase class V-fold PLP-dependent enzyme [Rasiella sp. SM2506]|uniref:aminotransferase class V-fold PLP-dependent enzyme n=1 Tax=Rasiella sp. SM2506 TaxID=3423914 RepID=UPI003D795A83
MQNQKHFFNLDNPITYLNGAYMSPQLKSVEAIGLDCLQKKSKPYLISEADFFADKITLKKRFAHLIEAPDYETIAIIPSVSYGIAIAVNNIPFEKGDEIIVLEEQFPSNYYAWKALEAEKGILIRTISAPEIKLGRGAAWNEKILEAINSKTKCIAIPHCHWADGTLFNLKALRERSTAVGAYLVIDGTQSVGALPFSIANIQPDALICGGYKWLMGPYGLGVAYYGERFHHGKPLENNWMNHVGSEDFSNLVHYNHALKPKATRYDVGESSNFILTPMLSEAIRQLNEWKPEHIQHYCKSITENSVATLKEAGYFIEEDGFRTHHLFGIYPENTSEIATLKEVLLKEKIYVSYRGKSIRISPNVYNTEEDVKKLTNCF